MPRSIWNGTITFGMMRVPIKVHSATQDKSVHFHEVHAKDGAQIEHRRMCAKEGKAVPYNQVAKGYEVKKGEYVLLDQDEIDAAAGRQSREIYRLLTEVMGQTDRAALGRFVMRAKEYLALVRERDGALTLTTMLFADETRPTKDIEAATQKSHKPTRKRLDAAVAVIEALSEDWDPDRHSGRYRDRLRKVLQRKRKGETITMPDEDSAPEPEPDLMAALERTLEDLAGKDT